MSSLHVPSPGRLLLAFGLAILYPSCAPAQTGAAAAGSLSGRITDASSGEAVVGANVYLAELERGTSTGPDGRFGLSGLPPGTYTLTVSHLGYAIQHIRVEFAPGEQTRETIALVPVDLEMGEIVVSAARPVLTTAENLGVIGLDMREVVRTPSVLAADVFRALHQLPGIQAASDFSSGLYVRGSHPGETLVQLEGSTIYNPSHFLGFFSTFNPDAIEQVTVEKSTFTAETSQHLGSVVGLSHRAPADSLDGRISVGLLSSGASLRGPHPLGGWALSVRRSTMEPVIAALNRYDVEGTPESFWFYDVDGRLTAQLSSRDWLEASFYRGRDEMDFPFQRDLVFDVGYGNYAGSLRWIRLLGERWMSQLQLRSSTYEADSDARMTRVPYGRSSGVEDYTLAGRLEYLPRPAHALTLGVEGRLFEFDVGHRHNRMTTLDRTLRPKQLSLWLQEEYASGERWTLLGGVRGDYFSAGSHWSLSPRARIAYRPTEDLRLQAGAGHYHQHLTLNTTSVFSSFNSWLPAGAGVGPARSTQLSGGLRWSLPRGLEVHLETYRRWLTDLFELDPRVGDATGLPYEALFRTGEGGAYGTELHLRRKTGRVSGHLSYTYATAARRFPGVNEGRYYAARFDRRHEVSALLEVRLGSEWTFSASGSYGTGQPVTRPARHFLLVDSPYQNHFHDIFVSRQNAARLPPYRRVDVGLTKEGRLFEGARYDLQLQVVNAFGFRNVWFELYSYDERYAVQEDTFTQIPVPLPNVSLSVSF